MEKLRKMQKGKRAKKHGFLKRSASHGGSKVLARRRKAKRKKLTVG
nr:50S ribosomal protein L34 [Candidatus Levybacteria bacterium]